MAARTSPNITKNRGKVPSTVASLSASERSQAATPTTRHFPCGGRRSWPATRADFDGRNWPRPGEKAGGVTKKKRHGLGKMSRTWSVRLWMRRSDSKMQHSKRLQKPSSEIAKNQSTVCGTGQRSVWIYSSANDPQRVHIVTDTRRNVKWDMTTLEWQVCRSFCFVCDVKITLYAFYIIFSIRKLSNCWFMFEGRTLDIDS